MLQHSLAIALCIQHQNLFDSIYQTSKIYHLLLRLFVVLSCDGKQQRQRQRPPVQVFIHVNDTVIKTPNDDTLITNRMVNRNINLNWNRTATVTWQICIGVVFVLVLVKVKY
jgi:hypothetical protein